MTRRTFYQTMLTQPEDSDYVRAHYQPTCFESLCKCCLFEGARKKLNVKRVTQALRPKLASLAKPGKLNFICGYLGTLPGECKMMVTLKGGEKKRCVYMKKTFLKHVYGGPEVGGAWVFDREVKKARRMCMVYDGVVIKVPWKLVEEDIEFESFEKNIDRNTKVKIQYIPENEFMTVLGYVEIGDTTTCEMKAIEQNHVEDMKSLLREEEVESLEAEAGKILMTNNCAVLGSVKPEEQCDYDTIFEACKKANIEEIEKEKKDKQKADEMRAMMSDIDEMHAPTAQEILKWMVKIGKIDSKELKQYKTKATS